MNLLYLMLAVSVPFGFAVSWFYFDYKREVKEDRGKATELLHEIMQKGSAFLAELKKFTIENELMDAPYFYDYSFAARIRNLEKDMLYYGSIQLVDERGRWKMNNAAVRRFISSVEFKLMMIEGDAASLERKKGMGVYNKWVGNHLKY